MSGPPVDQIVIYSLTEEGDRIKFLGAAIEPSYGVMVAASVFVAAQAQVGIIPRIGVFDDSTGEMIAYIGEESHVNGDA